MPRSKTSIKSKKKRFQTIFLIATAILVAVTIILNSYFNSQLIFFLGLIALFTNVFIAVFTMLESVEIQPDKIILTKTPITNVFNVESIEIPLESVKSIEHYPAKISFKKSFNFFKPEQILITTTRNESYKVIDKICIQKLLKLSKP